MAKTLQHPVFLLERELAQRWRISVRSLQRWRQEGSGPTWLKIQGRVIYPLSEVLDWEQGARQGAVRQGSSS
jgi:predicted site-specific integrase-resolvase